MISCNFFNVQILEVCRKSSQILEVCSYPLQFSSYNLILEILQILDMKGGLPKKNLLCKVKKLYYSYLNSNETHL